MKSILTLKKLPMNDIDDLFEDTKKTEKELRAFLKLLGSQLPGFAFRIITTDGKSYGDEGADMVIPAQHKDLIQTARNSSTMVRVPGDPSFSPGLLFIPELNVSLLLFPAGSVIAAEDLLTRAVRLSVELFQTLDNLQEERIHIQTKENQLNRQLRVLQQKNYQILEENQKQQSDYARRLKSEIKRQTAELRITNKELIKARQEAEAASQAKSDFLANMSHEIRTPLNGIIGMTEIALDSSVNANLKGLLSTILTEAESLLGLINDILDFSKIEAGKLELETLAFDLREVMDEFCEAMALSAQMKDLEFISYLPPECPSRLLGDPHRLKQILVNLAGNAVKFTSQGEIKITAELMEETPDRAVLRFIVSDTGIGIPEEKQAKVFEMFSQVDSSTTREYGGTGLGTTISKQLVELMDGKIGLESTTGEGTTFWFEIPFTKQTPIPSVRSISSPERLQALILDSNPTVRGVLASYFTALGVEAMSANALDQAVKILEEAHSRGEPFPLVLIADHYWQGDEKKLLLSALKTDQKKSPLLGLLSPKNRLVENGADIGLIWQQVYKPVTLKDLEKLIQKTAQKQLPQKAAIAPETSPAISPPQQPLQVLLAEDYPTNQKVALGHLTKAGFAVTVADNGAQAVEACRRRTFDLILMDIQMPVMDGYMATKAIRELEKTNGKKQTPIIALTAHAIKGYREHCLQKGMDDFITKPFKRDTLLAIINKWGSRPEHETDVPHSLEKHSREPEHRLQAELGTLQETGLVLPPLLPTSTETIDLKELNEIWDNDKEAIINAFSDFFGKSQSMLTDIQTAITTADTDKLDRCAHKFKGAMLYFAAPHATELAYQLEMMGKNKDLNSAGATFVALVRACEEFQICARKIQQDLGAGSEPNETQ